MKKSLMLPILLLAVFTSVEVFAQYTPTPIPKKKTFSKKGTSAAKIPVKSPAQNSTATAMPQSSGTPSKQLPATQSPPTQPSPRNDYQSVSSSNRSTPYTSPKHRSRSYAFENGDKLLNLGVGLTSYYYGNPIGASFEVGVDKDFSIGGQFDFNTSPETYYTYGYTAIYLGGRGSFHANRILNLDNKHLDVYAGLGLGYRSFRWNDGSYSYYSYYDSGLFLNYFLGGKYYFTDKIGGFMELGYTGLSSARVGLSVKF